MVRNTWSILYQLIEVLSNLGIVYISLILI